MKVGSHFVRRIQRRFAIGLGVITSLSIFFVLSHRSYGHQFEPRDRNPLLWEHVHSFNGTGGAWYIPPQWLSPQQSQPETIVEAAQMASQIASANNNHRVLSNTAIPRIMHQTWKNRVVDTWPDVLQDCVEQWLEHVFDDDMAYFLWEDAGIMSLMAEYESEFTDRFVSLPVNVERTDVFRVLVLKHFGGIYTDIDTRPLRPPATWVTPSDIEPWTDPLAEVYYDSTAPVSLILGIEADTDPESDTYWRAGYFYPIQLTQWALAAAAQHPVLLRFMDTLSSQLDTVATENHGSLNSPAAVEELRRIGPLALTGPAAMTAVTQSWLHEQVGLRWNALTGLLDGGRSKLVQDILILPITAFSPGRADFRKMGSRPVTDPAARLWHSAQGSWRTFDATVEWGKICRTLFAMCRDWPKTRDS